METWQSWPNRESGARIKKLPLMRIFSAQVFTLLLLCGIAGAQSKLVPTIEVFGGYSHLSLQTGSFGVGSWKEMNGFDFAVTVPHIVKGLGATVDGSGNYATTFKQYNYFVGPQYKWDLGRFNLIAHGLYGKSQTRLENPGSTFLAPSDKERSIAIGGEVDLPVANKVFWRILQGDVLITSAFGSSQRNVRLSTGLIYRFGKH